MYFFKRWITFSFMVQYVFIFIYFFKFFYVGTVGWSLYCIYSHWKYFLISNTIFCCNLKFLKKINKFSFQNYEYIFTFKRIYNLDNLKQISWTSTNSVCAVSAWWWCSRYRNVKGGNFLRQKSGIFLSCLSYNFRCSKSIVVRWCCRWYVAW